MTEPEEEAAACEEALAQELEVADAMYAADELAVRHEAGAGGPRAVLQFEVRLDRALVALEFALPRGFPLRRGLGAVRIKRSRGLVDSQETDLVREIERHAEQTFDELGQYSVVDLLLHAKEAVEQQNEGSARCAICLGPIAASDHENTFRASCWHLFHNECFAAWWKQVEGRRTGAGTEQSSAALQRQQVLRAAQARVDERVAQLKALKDRQAALNEQATSVNALISQAETLPADKREAFEKENEPVSALRRRVATVQEQLKASKQEASACVAKLTRETAELDQLRAATEEQDRAASEQGIDCPMCRLPIEYSEMEHFLKHAVANLTSAGAASTLVPAAWTAAEGGPPLTAQAGSYLDVLTPEQRERFQSEQRRRKLIFERQRANGAHVNPEETSGHITLSNLPPSQSAGAACEDGSGEEPACATTEQSEPPSPPSPRPNDSLGRGRGGGRGRGARGRGGRRGGRGGGGGGRGKVSGASLGPRQKA